MWEPTLKDLIRGMRAHKFIAQAIDEIRDEVKSKDIELRTAAIFKLNYLHMLGCAMSWASFYGSITPESNRIPRRQLVVSRKSPEEGPDFHAAPDCRRIQRSRTVRLCRPCTRPLDEFITMLTHSRAAIFKRAILALYKMVTKQPEVLHACFPRMHDKLEDPDSRRA